MTCSGIALCAVYKGRRIRVVCCATSPRTGILFPRPPLLFRYADSRSTNILPLYIIEAQKRVRFEAFRVSGQLQKRGTAKAGPPNYGNGDVHWAF